jgi:hypothetical protein
VNAVSTSPHHTRVLGGKTHKAGEPTAVGEITQ